MHSQYSANDCLSEAMYIAAHSYSASAYETSSSRMMDALCDEMPAFMPNGEQTSSSAFAA